MSAPTVLILAAGRGTRMRSAMPKVLHPICGRPMVLWPVRAAQEAGAGRIVVVDSPERASEQVLGEGVELAVQPQPNGTGGAVAAALSHLGESLRADEHVVVLSGDVPLIGAAAIGELLAAHLAAGAVATMATTMLEDPSGYGRVLREQDGTVARVVETKRAGDAGAAELAIKEVNTGIFVFQAGPLVQALPLLRAENAQQELYLPEVLGVLRSGGGTIHAHLIEDERIVLGVNDRVALARVRSFAQAAIHERHMLAGVTILDPACTVVDADVEIGEDTVIEPFSSLCGSTRVGRGCLIRHSHLLDCELQDGASVGPFAYLRPGAALGPGAKVGTFVEIKNSQVGAGAKVPHLSYIGDATIGAGTNLGASTVTANYDGRSKHRTTIGSGVRTGVDTTLVAPVTVGDEAVTAAGSVITDDIPPKALGVARERQVNIEGYADRKPARDGSPR
ncbi:MAG: bifunctional UDP-N-acetylglucosamine diphosphorylase/glucosamine-1-phosphate N-acetyltransferase GlmU [Solirubrobacteraceae bacterium]